MDLTDRFTGGFIAGLIGGISTTITGYPLYLLKISTLRFADFAAILIYGHKPYNLVETLFAILINWGFAAAGGIIFVYLIKAISSKNLIFKGWFLGVSIWFLAFIISTLFKVPGLVEVTFKNAFINFLISSIYGMVMAVAYCWLKDRWGEANI
jgi:hypothetical protein